MRCNIDGEKVVINAEALRHCLKYAHGAYLDKITRTLSKIQDAHIYNRDKNPCFIVSQEAKWLKADIDAFDLIADMENALECAKTRAKVEFEELQTS